MGLRVLQLGVAFGERVNGGILRFGRRAAEGGRACMRGETGTGGVIGRVRDAFQQGGGCRRGPAGGVCCVAFKGLLVTAMAARHARCCLPLANQQQKTPVPHPPTNPPEVEQP